MVMEIKLHTTKKFFPCHEIKLNFKKIREVRYCREKIIMKFLFYRKIWRIIEQKKGTTDPKVVQLAVQYVALILK